MYFYSRFIASLCLATGLLFLTGCDSASTSGGIVHGISWTKDVTNVYDWSYASIDSAGEPILQQQATYAVRTAATRDRVNEWTDLIRLEGYLVDNEDEKQFTWYRQTDKDLRELAYIVSRSIPIVQPKRSEADGAFELPSVYGLPRAAAALLPEQLAKDPAGDSIQVRMDPRVVFVFPLEEGTKWTAFERPFLQTREVIGYADVTVEAGTFRCAEVVTRIPELAPDMKWTDYVSEIGIVLRTVTHEHDQRDPQGRPIAPFRTEERLELVRRSR